jgi:putative two-component system response regulator
MIYDPGHGDAARSLKAVARLITDAEKECRLLVVDDDQPNLNLITRILKRAGFRNVQALAQASVVMDAMAAYEPDLVVLDLHLPGVDGVQLLEDINNFAGRTYLPVIVLTGDASMRARDAALAAGAKDFLTKPYEPSEVVLRVRNLIETRLLHVELRRQNSMLQERFAARTAELEAAKIEILDRLARASDFRDEVTHQHTARVGDLAALIAYRLGMPDHEVDQLRVAARLHDIGKIGLSDSILQKPGPLGPSEFRAQERHTLIGANILAGSRFPILRVAEQIALTHHEAWDGTGYPRGLKGEEIPMVGRIVAVADVFDALTHERPYKSAWKMEDAAAEIRAQAGRKFDPAVVAAFATICDDGLLGELAHGPPKDEFDFVGPHAEPERARIVRDVIRRGALG